MILLSNWSFGLAKFEFVIIIFLSYQETFDLEKKKLKYHSEEHS